MLEIAPSCNCLSAVFLQKAAGSRQMARRTQGDTGGSSRGRRKDSRGAELRIGTSGYHYNHWSGVFYPEGLNKKEWFAYYARNFDTVEINNTFYRLPPTHVFDAWREAAPPGFCYALKFSRYGTHLKRLREPAEPIRRFLKHAERLRDALGPILVQLPPHWQADFERLGDFVKRLPGAHRWTMEFRDPSWLTEQTYELLARHNVALCVHDMLPDHPRRVTADFTYLRYHGRRYAGSYSARALSVQAQRIREYRADGIGVYAYFNNDGHGYAVENALALKRYLQLDKAAANSAFVPAQPYQG